MFFNTNKNTTRRREDNIFLQLFFVSLIVRKNRKEYLVAPPYRHRT